MVDESRFDVDQTHRYFSAHCFNSAWGLIDKADRTADENEEMIRLSLASLWHWTQQADCRDKNLSIGYWQVSRVYALVGEGEAARKYGQLCLEKSGADEPFLLGYAHEALARAETVLGHAERAKKHLAEAWGHAERVTDAENKAILIDDLKTLA